MTELELNDDGAKLDDEEIVYPASLVPVFGDVSVWLTDAVAVSVELAGAAVEEAVANVAKLLVHGHSSVCGSKWVRIPPWQLIALTPQKPAAASATTLVTETISITLHNRKGETL